MFPKPIGVVFVESLLRSLRCLCASYSWKIWIYVTRIIYCSKKIMSNLIVTISVITVWNKGRLSASSRCDRWIYSSNNTWRMQTDRDSMSIITLQLILSIHFPSSFFITRSSALHIFISVDNNLTSNSSSTSTSYSNVVPVFSLNVPLAVIFPLLLRWWKKSHTSYTWSKISLFLPLDFCYLWLLSSVILLFFLLLFFHLKFLLHSGSTMLAAFYFD